MRNNAQRWNNLSAFCMLAAVVMYSLLPVSIKWGEGHKFPFLFMATCYLVSCLISGLVLQNFYPEFTRVVKDVVKNNIIKKKERKHAFLFLVGGLDYVLFTVSAQFVGYAVIAVVYEVWVFLFVFYMSYIYKNEQRYKFTVLATTLLTLLAFFGVIFVLISQYKADSFFENYKNLILGGGLAFCAAVCTCLAAHGFLWATNMKNAYRKMNKQLAADAVNTDIFSNLGNSKTKNIVIEICFSVFLFIIRNLVVALLVVLVGIGTGENVKEFAGHVIEGHWVPILAIGGIIAVAGILWRMSNLLTDNLSINAMSYLTPIFTVFCLWALFGIDIEYTGLFIIGTLAVVVANLLINFSGSVRRSYKALIISLWGFGAWVYLVPGSTINIETYFQIVAIASTMYILLVSFRLDRLVRRTTAEEELSLELFEKISAKIWEKEKTAKTEDKFDEFAVALRGYLEQLDSTDESIKFHNIYNKVKVKFYNFYKTLNRQNSEDMEKMHMLHDLESDFNKYVHSKQQGYNFGELMTLGILGMIIVSVLMLTVPGKYAESVSAEELSLTIFSLNTFAMLISATVVFLFFNILDLQADRREKIMGKEERGDGVNAFGILFRDVQERNFGRGLSIIVCIAIVLTYSGLFYDKWVMNGWFLTT